MINKSLILKDNQNAPFLLKPIGKDYLWGGNRLNEDFSKDIKLTPLAETWECSTHPDGISIVSSGIHKDSLLSDVLKSHPEYLGSNVIKYGDLPILIKLIDAKKDLSVQVHPSDEYANKYENGQRGKTEMWYILDTTNDAKIIYGFYHDIDRETLKQSLNNGTVEKYLQKIKVHTDDVFYIEAGQVHAIGEGSLIAEIQENSNLTYRMYDYNRVDKNGKLRELHIEKALDVVNLKSSAEPKQPLRVLKYKQGYASELLCRCKYFQVERILINTERCRNLTGFKTDGNSFQVLLCTNGCGIITNEVNQENINFFRGDCIFFPANSQLIKLHGKAQFLKVTC